MKVTAISALGSKTGDASITLVPLPWAGWKRNLLGFYLFGVFSLVFLLVGLWPPSQPDPAKTAAKNAAQAIVDSDAKDKDFAEHASKLKAAKDAVNAGKSLPKDALDQLTKNLADAQDLLSLNKREKRSSEDALGAVRAKRAHLWTPSLGQTHPCLGVEWDSGYRETLICCFEVLIGGALGAFLHSARSFTDFVGNQEIKGSWAWWYYLHPFIGAILALTFYMAVRGGFLAITTGTDVKTQYTQPLRTNIYRRSRGNVFQNCDQKTQRDFRNYVSAEQAYESQKSAGTRQPWSRNRRCSQGDFDRASFRLSGGGNTGNYYRD